MKDERFPVDEQAARALDDYMARRTEISRAAYEREWEGAERLGRLLSAGDGRLSEALKAEAPQESARLCIDARLAETIGRLKATTETAETEFLGLPESYHAREAREHQMTFMSGGGFFGDRLTIRAKPYDTEWTYFKPDDAYGTAARGPSASKLYGSMSIDLTETYVDRPVAYGGWMRAGAGVGLWFKPKAPSTYVRVAPMVNYEYAWRDDSWLQVAHNFGEVCTRVQRWRGPGNLETIIDRREPLWSDGTSWYQTHEGADGGYWVNHDYFFGSSNDWYLVWVWCNGGIDFATKSFIGSSKAFQIWKVRVPWVVFEQWA